MRIGIRSTHQRLAYEATKYLPKERRNVLLAYLPELIDGSTAPDRKFKDFRNHVLHPSPKGLWGGAIEAAKKRYKKAVELAKQGRRKEFAFAMGVLSHYVADPTMPLHTAQDPGEENVHKFYERGTSELRRTWKITPIERPKDIERMLEDSARKAFEKYPDVMRLYDPTKGRPFHRKDGYSPELYEITEEMLTLALSNVVTVRREVIKELEEEGIKPPNKGPGILTALKQVALALREFFVRVGAERELKRMREEILKYGAVRTPDEEQRAYKKIFEEPRRKGIYVSPSETTRKEARPRVRFRLELDDPIEKAPGIGKKSGKRLREIGIKTVKDLLEAPEEKLEGVIRDPELVKTEAALMIEIPGLLVREAEALARVGIKRRADLLKREGKEGELARIMRERLRGMKFWGKELGLSEEEIKRIIERAKLGRDLESLEG